MTDRDISENIFQGHLSFLELSHFELDLYSNTYFPRPILQDFCLVLSEGYIFTLGENINKVRKQLESACINLYCCVLFF